MRIYYVEAPTGGRYVASDSIADAVEMFLIKCRQSQMSIGEINITKITLIDGNVLTRKDCPK